ncbi:hypothetical protein TYRP_013678 [Tyrophagus putrescentiae]|nr:hypothetical protein TYRP_013678 [Tyrophagus putrescentiae]
MKGLRQKRGEASVAWYRQRATSVTLTRTDAEDVLLLVVVEEALRQKRREEVRAGEGRGGCADVVDVVSTGSLLKHSLGDGEFLLLTSQLRLEQRLAHQPGCVLGGAPGQRDAMAAVALHPDRLSLRPQSHPLEGDLSLGEAGHQLGAAAPDRLAVQLAEGHIAIAVVLDAAQGDVVAAGDDVGAVGEVEVTDPGRHHLDRLPADRRQQVITGEPRCLQPRSIDHQVKAVLALQFLKVLDVSLLEAPAPGGDLPVQVGQVVARVGHHRRPEDAVLEAALGKLAVQFPLAQGANLAREHLLD